MKTGLIRWTARFIVILAILFISLFAADAFAPGLNLWKQLGGFFMHLIPSLILLIFLIIAWKRELFGGILFILIGLGASPFIFMKNFKMNNSVWASLGIILMISIPFIVAGLLFILSYRLDKKRK